MGRTEWCELVSGVCRLTGGTEGHTEEPEGSEHVSAWLRCAELRERRGRTELRTADGTAQSHCEERRFGPCQPERRKHR